MPKKMVPVVETDDKNAFSNGTGGVEGYGLIASREVVMIILVGWPEVGWRLAGNELKR